MFSIPNLKTVEGVMEKTVTTIDKELRLSHGLLQMAINNQKTLIVANNQKELKGIISMTDIQGIFLKDENADLENMIIEDFMKKDVIYVDKNTSLDKCRDIMIKNNIGLLPVLENKNIIGVLNQNHIRDHLYMNLEDYGITLKHIMGEIKEGICAINKNGIVILWNKFMEERYSIKSDKIVGNHINEFLKDTISERVLKQKVHMNEIYYSNKKGGKYGLVDANPMFVENEFMGVVCTEVDVTEAKILSEKLEQTNQKLKYLQDEVKNLSRGSFDKILGNSYKIEKSKEIAKKVATTSSSILVYGESGTGKEVFSRAIHDYSERKGQFIPINCSAIPSELFESEFFGYEAGAFTGANKKGKMGIFELATNGTVFLDEIGELPLSMQAKLLRVLQEKEVRRIGGEKLIKINCRVICATNKNLQELVQKGEFREDLYYRLNVVEINLPPLRERKEDLEILIYKFLEEVCSQNNKSTVNISKDAMRKLKSYKWKGNIRELKNTIESIVVLSRGTIVEKDDLPENILKSDEDVDEESFDIVKETEILEKKIIKKALEHCKGNKTKASKMLNIPRTTLCYKVNKYEIDC
ncbi:sigma-54 dependent transcriptional regulator PrdR [Romboutsia sp.]|uniref:sigma-54 dependent transcriptional regulator PrdR n=1 Tax=Romboutsia sp. TaxID=1965302 RepID=UPI003F3B125C